MNKIEIDNQVFDSETGEFINDVEQVEVEIIEESLPAIICSGGTHIKTNTVQLKRELTLFLEKYDIEVTAETEKDASKMATELNKLAKDLNSKRLEVGKEIKKPADELKKNIDELIAIVQEKRTNIITSVDVFKQKRFDRIRMLLETERSRLFIDLEISIENQILDIESLVKESSLATTNLTKSATETLLSMARAVKSLQDTVKIRKLELKSLCLERGLNYPIELEEVQHIIKSEDYNQQLDLMIESHLRMEEKIKADAEQKKNDAIAKIQKEVEDKEANRLVEEKRQADEIAAAEKREQDKIDQESFKREAEEKATGKKIVNVVATFEVEVGLDIEDQEVMDQYERKLRGLFTTLKSVTPF